MVKQFVSITAVKQRCRDMCYKCVQFPGEFHSLKRQTFSHRTPTLHHFLFSSAELHLGPAHLALLELPHPVAPAPRPSGSTVLSVCEMVLVWGGHCIANPSSLDGWTSQTSKLAYCELCPWKICSQECKASKTAGLPYWRTLFMKSELQEGRDLRSEWVLVF